MLLILTPGMVLYKDGGVVTFSVNNYMETISTAY